MRITGTSKGNVGRAGKHGRGGGSRDSYLEFSTLRVQCDGDHSDAAAAHRHVARHHGPSAPDDAGEVSESFPRPVQPGTPRGHSSGSLWGAWRRSTRGTRTRRPRGPMRQGCRPVGLGLGVKVTVVAGRFRAGAVLGVAAAYIHCLHGLQYGTGV